MTGKITVEPTNGSTSGLAAYAAQKALVDVGITQSMWHAPGT